MSEAYCTSQKASRPSKLLLQGGDPRHKMAGFQIPGLDRLVPNPDHGLEETSNEWHFA